jgi:beta-lactamase regulating signal transducer with metallopeptidase domain
VLFLIHLSETAFVIKSADSVSTTTGFDMTSQKNRQINHKLSRHPSKLDNSDISILLSLDGVVSYVRTMFFLTLFSNSVTKVIFPRLKTEAESAYEKLYIDCKSTMHKVKKRFFFEFKQVIISKMF